MNQANQATKANRASQAGRSERAIPEGFMTVGEVAKKMNTTVRTLQYYDKEGLLSPTAESEGGRRLYTNRDIIRLHQIQSMKYLGFSLDDIKNRLINLETPAEVAEVLTEQAKLIKEQIASLTEVLDAIEKLKHETQLMATVDWAKYADIIVNLQLKNEWYGLIKLFDDDTLEHLRSQFDRARGEELVARMNDIFELAIRLEQSGTPADSEQGIELGKAWWDIVMECTGGDASLLPQLLESTTNNSSWNDIWKQRWESVEGYVTESLVAYFENIGYNPFEQFMEEQAGLAVAEHNAEQAGDAAEEHNALQADIAAKEQT